MKEKVCSDCLKVRRISEFYAEKRKSFPAKNTRTLYEGLTEDQRPTARCKQCTDRANRWSAYRQGAKTRGYEFSLSKEEFLFLLTSPCFYCASPPQENILRNNLGVNGIDRLDNSLGYISGNVVPCCSRCNTAKSSMSYKEFMEWIGRVYFHSLEN